MAKLINRIQNVIIFSPFLKKVSYRILTSHRVTCSRIYNYIYLKKMKTGMKTYSKIPHRLRIENTNICNAKCIFCPHGNMKRQQGVMDMGLFKKIIDEASFYKIPLVSIYGFGEPLLDRYLFDRVEYAKRKAIKKVATNTNASFLKMENIDRLLGSRLDEVYISFDAATETTYREIRPGLDFATVESNIKTLVREKRVRKLKIPRIYLSFVECPQNQHEVSLYLKKWKGVVDGISISYLHNWAGKFSGEHLLKDTKRRDPCRFLWTDMPVSWDGKVTICCYDYENEVVIGDLSDNGIVSVWTGEPLKRLRQIHTEGHFDKIDICKECVANVHSKNPWWVVR